MAVGGRIFNPNPNYGRYHMRNQMNRFMPRGMRGRHHHQAPPMMGGIGTAAAVGAMAGGMQGGGMGGVVAGASSVVGLDDCTRRCEACERCRYVSLSHEHAECSWYAECDMRKLVLNNGGWSYRSRAVGAAKPYVVQAFG